MKKRLRILGNIVIILAITIVSILNYRELRSKLIQSNENYLANITSFFDRALSHNIEKSGSNDDFATIDENEESSQTEITDQRSTENSNVTQELLEQTIGLTFETFNVLTSDLRITVMDETGKVLADSNFPGDKLNNHRARPEVWGVISGEESHSNVRFSNTESVERLYFSARSTHDNMIVRAAVLMDFLSNAASTITLSGFIIGVATLVLFNLVLHLLFKKQDKHQADLEKVLIKLESGDLSARMEEDRNTFANYRKFAENFNQTVTNFEHDFNEMQAGRAWLEEMVNSLMEPLVVVNNDLQVVFANKYAKTLFNRDIDPIENPYPFVLLTHEDKLDDLCQQVLNNGKTVRKEFKLQVTGRYNAFQVMLSPIDVDHVVVLFNDISAEYEARELRSSFVANVTHELKTPLTSIRGFVETLRNRNNTAPEQVNNFLEIIDIEAARLERLINDILRLSDIERLNNDSEMEDFDLVELLDECLVQLDDQASEKQINLIPSDDPTFLPVKANRDRIKQVLLNLLENAIKYHRKKGNIWIDLKRKGRFVTIKVKDDGYGFDEQSAKRVFERFYRVDKSRSRMLGGTGLGLSIVKHIALLYDGEASVKSIPDKGSTFKVMLKI
ncbi:MAG: PAS domain-containing protein [Clostridiaceae bacterium]|nr:PAS domain-containing protein [Clostridiaceae bacterium]